MAQLAREVVLGQTSGVVHPGEFTRVGTALTLSRASRLSLAADALDVEALAPLLSAAAAEDLDELSPTRAAIFSQRVRFGINTSWVINIFLLIAKVVAFVLSGSYAVLASAVDSLVDVLSQAILAVAEYQAARFDQRFPIGRTRMAELSVMACACIMFVSTSLVLREAAGSLWAGFHGHPPVLVVDEVLFAVLGAATLLKLGLYLYCRSLRKNPIMVALSEDHLNDVMSNIAAVAGAAVAGNLSRYWYVDPAVALLFSLLIIRNWLMICWEQGQKMIGLEAPEELIQEVTEVTTTHNPAMQLDRLTAYHHGSHIVVEVEVILPAGMTVRESHDIALELQHKIEAIDSVERAFVHVDYARRSLEEHKVERNLKLGEKDVMKPLAGLETSPTGAGWARKSRGPDELLVPATTTAAPLAAAAAVGVAALDALTADPSEAPPVDLPSGLSVHHSRRRSARAGEGSSGGSGSSGGGGSGCGSLGGSSCSSRGPERPAGAGDGGGDGGSDGNIEAAQDGDGASA